MRRSYGYLVFVLLIVAIFFAYFKLRNERPRRQAMVENFRLRKPQFENLRELLEKDSKIRTVAQWGVLTVNSPLVLTPPVGDMPLIRYEEYLALLKKVDAVSAFRTSGALPDYCVQMWASGWASDTAHLAICWMSLPPPATSISRLDDYIPSVSVGKGHIFCERIEDNWYLQWDS